MNSENDLNMKYLWFYELPPMEIVSKFYVNCK